MSELPAEATKTILEPTLLTRKRSKRTCPNRSRPSRNGCCSTPAGQVRRLAMNTFQLSSIPYTVFMSTVHHKAQRHLARRDPVLKRLIGEAGPCTLQPLTDHFAALVRSIVSQQISTKAAASILARLQQTVARHGLTPRGILKAPDETLRAAGLSASKIRAVRDLADKVHRAEVPLHELHQLPDEEVIARLDPVRGIGRWTAEMFLIFSLGRPDVLPVDDLGLRMGVQIRYGLALLPGKQELMDLAEPWRPYRSIGTWYIWRSRAIDTRK
jgi:DNA-3-methyladenine glycosylase II